MKKKPKTKSESILEKAQRVLQRDYTRKNKPVELTLTRKDANNLKYILTVGNIIDKEKVVRFGTAWKTIQVILNKLKREGVR